MSPILVELRVHPKTFEVIRERLKAKLDAADKVTLTAIRIVTDASVPRGWLHEHDAAGTLIQSIPPVGVRRLARN